MIRRWCCVGLACLAAGAGCDRNLYVPPDPDGDPAPIEGTGSYTFAAYAPLEDKPVRVYYHVPDDADADTPIVFVFHGVNRNADDYRNAWIGLAEEHGLLILAPEFSDLYYPGSSRYNLGNVFSNGNDATGPNPESVWTFSVVEPIFEQALVRLDSDQEVFHAWGHSAGAQFVHRLALLVPDGPYGTLISANAGWYTIPDPEVDFPYGLGKTPSADAEPDWYGLDLSVHAGDQDTNPDSAALRHTPEADAQGLNRWDRAHYFWERAEALSDEADVPLAWSFLEVPGVGHDDAGMAEAAAPWLVERIGAE